MAEELLNDVDKAILILSIRDVGDISVISTPITKAATRTRTRLLIAIFCPFYDDDAPGRSSWDAVQRLLTHTYVQATTISQKHNKILMSVDVILRGVHRPVNEESIIDDWSIVFYSGRIEDVPVPAVWQSLPLVRLPGIPEHSDITSTSVPNMNNPSIIYPVVVLGGTFDHLHPGHKILLSMAAWIAGRKVIVGVTDDLLLVNKAHRDLLESFSARCDAVRNFLQLFKPGLICDAVPITDVYGPTGWDPDIQALVVSKETLPGAASIAAIRAEKSLPPLKTFVIDVISSVSSDLGTDDPETLKNVKMSSTFIRQWIYEQKVATGSDIKKSGEGLTKCVEDAS